MSNQDMPDTSVIKTIEGYLKLLELKHIIFCMQIKIDAISISAFN